MPQARFEPAISAGEWPQTYALESQRLGLPAVLVVNNVSSIIHNIND